MKKTELYVANGKLFKNFKAVEDFAVLNGYKVTKTETINTKAGKRHIIYLNK